MRLVMLTALSVAAFSLFCACTVGVAVAPAVSSGDTGDGGAGGAGGEGGAVCDPLGTSAVTVSKVLGAGTDKNGVLFVMSDAAMATPDIFVRHPGGALEKKDTLGSGTMGGGASADYSVTFVDGNTTAENVLLQIRSGAPMEMALGPTTTKGFIGTAGAVTEVLTLVDAKTLDGASASVTTAFISYIGDAADGRHIALIGPGAGARARLFYGKADSMVEYAWTQEPQALSAPQTTIDFKVASVSFRFTTGQFDGGLQPNVLLGSDGTTTNFTPRAPSPSTLPGFAFTCL